MSNGLKGHVAIIDDDALVRHALRDCMESAGYSVEGYGSAEEFLASRSAEGALCLVVDLELPGISGLELQDRLAGRDRHAPIVFVTAHGSDANRERAIKRGAAAFLAKPVRREELLNSVRAAIQR